MAKQALNVVQLVIQKEVPFPLMAVTTLVAKCPVLSSAFYLLSV